MTDQVSNWPCPDVLQSNLRWSRSLSGGAIMKSLSLDRIPSITVGGTKTRTAAYWATTGVLAFCMTGGVFELLGAKTTMDGIMRLGYPSYIIPALGLGKVLAILA